MLTSGRREHGTPGTEFALYGSVLSVARKRSTSARASSRELISPLSWASRTCSSRSGEMGAGSEAVVDEGGAVDERPRIEALGGPGEPLAAEGERWIVSAGDDFVKCDEFACPSWVSNRCSLGQGSCGCLGDERLVGEQPGGAFDFFVGVAEAAAEGRSEERGAGSREEQKCRECKGNRRCV